MIYFKNSKSENKKNKITKNLQLKIYFKELKKDYPKSEINKKIEIIPNPEYEEVFERFRNSLGMSEGKVEIYNPNAKEGEICLISYNNKFSNSLKPVFFYIKIENGQHVIRNRWYEKIEIIEKNVFNEYIKIENEEFLDTFYTKNNELTCSFYENEEFLFMVLKRYFEEGYLEPKQKISVINNCYKEIQLGDNFHKAKTTLSITKKEKHILLEEFKECSSTIESSRYIQYEFIENGEIQSEMFFDIKSDKLVTLIIYDKGYQPFDDMKIGDTVTNKMKEKYGLYYESEELNDEYGYISEIYKNFSIDTVFENNAEIIKSFYYGLRWFPI